MELGGQDERGKLHMIRRYDAVPNHPKTALMAISATA
jgi:hypothetical protein